MAEFLAKEGYKHLPISEILSTAGLVESLAAAKKFGLLPLYGQKLNFSQSSILFFPEDLKAASQLNRFCSRLCFIASENGIDPEKLTTEQIAGAIEQLPPRGQGRVIFAGRALPLLIETFIEAGWKTFLDVGSSKNIEEQEKIAEFCRHYQAKPIYAPEITAISHEDKQLLQLVKAIHSGNLLANTSCETSIFKPESNPENQAALANNIEFAQMPTFVPETGRLKMPVFLDNALESMRLLREKCQAGLIRKYAEISPRIRERFEFELQTIANLGFTDYFLIVDEITAKAKELGVRVLGRGSAANSLISYVLDFTQVDPIKYDLYFERFLNPFRKSPPDIDLDFSWKIRDQIYHFLRERWGEDRVALISTHIRLSSRSAVRETGKALGISGEELNYLSSLLGHARVADFIDDPVGKARYRPDLPRLNQHLGWLKLAARIEGLPTHFSIHAGGVVIAPDSLFNYTIIQPSSKALPITQLEMHACESLGLVKFDLLSQRALGVYADLAGNLPESPPNDPEKIENDAKVRVALSRGDTLGVFYIESPGMRGLLGKMKCSSFAELVAASSIIRPGVAESGMMQEYIKRHLNPSGWKPLHPLLGEILRETYGIMVYQEDVMKVAHHLAGFSLGEADVLRRAMSGKERSPDQMQTARRRFLDGAAGNAIEPAIAEEIWRQISSFCGYAFCKAHSAAYAVLSLELLWAKVYFPGWFYAAVLNNRGGFYGAQAYISAAIRAGLKILPPDVNSSDADFSVSSDSALKTGLSFITGLKNTTISRIIEQRQKAPFASLLDFIERIAPDQDEFDNLVGSGGLIRFGNKPWCRWQFKTSRKAGLFAEELAPLPLQIIGKDDRLTRIRDELQTLGFAVSGHPTELFPIGAVQSNRLGEMIGKNVEVTGLLIATKSVTTSRNEKMKFITLEDRRGLIETVFFPQAWRNVTVSLDKACVLTIGGQVKNDAGQTVIQGKWLKQL